MPSPDLGPRGGKYPHHVTQSILVPKSRSDVRGDADRARVVAERYGARPGGKVVEQENFFAFRQVNPDKIQDGTYVSFKVPHSGVVLRKGLPISARKNPAPSEGPGLGTFLAIGAVVVVGLAIFGSRTAQATAAPNPNAPVSPPPPPPPTVRRPAAPAPTYVRQADGFDPGSATATRVLQQQLRSLGYHVPTIDGVFGPDTTRAVTAFMDANDQSFDRTSARDIFTLIDVQYAYFFDTRGGLRSI